MARMQTPFSFQNKPAAASRLCLFVFLLITVQLRTVSADVSILRTNARKIADETGRSIVNIQIIHKENNRRYYLASFSGVVLQGKKHLILTCCGDAIQLLKSKQNSLEITYKDLWTGKGTVFAKDKNTGLCLIQCTGRLNPPKGISLNPSCNNPKFLKKGLRILTISNPFGIENSVRYGVVCGTVYTKEKSPLFVHRLYLYGIPGEGGGCVCDFNGKFAGIIRPVPYETTSQGRRFCAQSEHWPRAEVLPLQIVTPVVEQLKNKKNVLRGYVGAKFSIEPKADHILVRVTSVIPGGPASQAGLKNNDIICRIRNNTITSYEALYRTALWVEYEGLGKKLPLTIKREKNGREKQLSIRIGLYPEIPPKRSLDAASK